MTGGADAHLTDVLRPGAHHSCITVSSRPGLSDGQLSPVISSCLQLSPVVSSCLQLFTRPGSYGEEYLLSDGAPGQGAWPVANIILTPLELWLDFMTLYNNVTTVICPPHFWPNIMPLTLTLGMSIMMTVTKTPRHPPTHFLSDTSTRIWNNFYPDERQLNNPLQMFVWVFLSNLCRIKYPDWAALTLCCHHHCHYPRDQYIMIIIITRW